MYGVSGSYFEKEIKKFNLFENNNRLAARRNLNENKMPNLQNDVWLIVRTHFTQCAYRTAAAAVDSTSSVNLLISDFTHFFSSFRPFILSSINVSRVRSICFYIFCFTAATVFMEFISRKSIRLLWFLTLFYITACKAGERCVKNIIDIFSTLCTVWTSFSYI